MSTFVPSWFGKLPQHREYINRGEKRLSEIGMREWLDASVQLARSEMGRDAKERFASLPTVRFLWPSGGAHVAGCIDRGGDAAGRGYPFVLFADVRLERAEVHRAPLRLGRVGTAMARAVEEARRAPDIASAQEVLAGGIPFEEAPASAYDELMQTPAVDLIDSQREDDDVSRHQLVQGLIDCLGVFRGQPRDGIKVCLRFRLRRGATADHETAFWLAAASAVLGAPLEGVTVFWTPGEDGYPPIAFLYFRPPIGSQFLGMLDPERDVRSISRVDQSFSPKPPEERMAEHVRAVVEDERATLADYVEVLGRS